MGEEFSLDLKWLKKLNWVIIILIIFLILGVYLRSYHLDFPSIGYHNMKENEYLDQAYFFTEEGDFFHKRAFAFSGLNEKTVYHEEYGQAPLVPYMISIFWSIFGQSLLIPRLLMVAFFMAAVFMTYLIAKRLTDNEYLSLLSAGLMTIMPLGIYFGRNVQPEPPALFFALLGAYFFIKWVDTSDKNQLLYATLGLGIAGLFKYTFLIFVVPLLFIFPYKQFYEKFLKNRKAAIQDTLYAFYGFIPLIIGVIIYEFLTIVDTAQRNYAIEPFRIFTSDFWVPRWPVVLSFIKDNYTLWFAFIALIGLGFILLKYRTMLGKFLIGYAIAIIPYVAIISSKIAGHSYYQIPFLPLVVILSAYALFAMGTILKQVTKVKYLVYLPLILIIFAIPSMQAANDRVYGTVFYGQDFLGEYLKTRLTPGEQFAAFTHSQDLATCSYSKHQCGFIGNLDDFKRKEDFFNLRYLYVGASEMNKLTSDDPLWVYIRANYAIDLVGLMQISGRFVPTHMILKRGGVFDLANIEGKQPQLAKTYDTKQGPVPYYYIQNL